MVRTEKVVPEGVIFFPEGYLDRQLGAELSAEIQKAINDGVKAFVVSFSKVKMINSLGVSELIESYDKIDTAHGELWLADLSNQVKQILEAAGVIDLVFEINIMTLDEARDRLKSEFGIKTISN